MRTNRINEITKTTPLKFDRMELGYAGGVMRLLCWVSSLFLLAPLLAAGQNLGETSGPWVMERSGTTAGLRGIHAVGGGVAWASGTNGTVLRTEDGGYEWQSCAMPPGAEKLDFRGIWAWDDQTAIVMSSGTGDASRLYKTTDGCSHWKLLFTNPDKDGFWDAILFLDRQRGFLLGDPVRASCGVGGEEGGDLRFCLLVTLDGGEKWYPAYGLIPPHSGESEFAASNSAMITAGDWLIFGTNRGLLRGRITDGATRSVFSSFGCGSKVEDWTAGPLQCDHPWTGWEAVHTPLASGSDSSGIFSLAFRDGGHGMAVGGDYARPNESTGAAAWSADGGKTWTAAVKPPHGYRSAVAWDSASKAWIAAGTNGSDISYDDGKAWVPLDNGNWNALSLPWIVGPNGRIAKLDADKLPKPPEQPATTAEK